MPLLETIYWLAFGLGLIYVLLSGALGALAHGVHGAGAGAGGEAGGHGFEPGHQELDLHSGDLNQDGASLEGQDGGQDGVQGSGLHAEAHSEGGADALDSGQFQQYNPFSLLSIMGCICGFGAGGLIGAYFKLGILSVATAVLGAAAMAALLWLVIGKLFYSLQGSSEAHVDEMIGLEADVITPVEHEMSGEIAYILGGTRYTAPARLDKPGRIPLHGKVRIRRVSGNMVYVEERRKLLD